MEKPEQKLHSENDFPNNEPSVLPTQDGEGYLFFNVMPKTKDATNIVAPKLVVENNSHPLVEGPSFYLKYKAYIIIGAIVLICAPIGYFVLQKLQNQPLDNDIFINPAAIEAAKQKTATSSPTTGETFTISAEWMTKYFPGCTDTAICGDNADPDKDGLINLRENKLVTDPNNADSDQDGLADGDEAQVFSSDPLKKHTANDDKYSDLDYVKNGYNVTIKGERLSEDEISTIRAKMAQFGLHTPTTITVGTAISTTYGYSDPSASTTPISLTKIPANASTTADQSLEAKQDRDAQRSNTIKNIQTALLSYNDDKNKFPTSGVFSDMFSTIKPYLKVATNPLDPINKSPFLYGYIANSDGSDFTLSFYSEVAGQIIKKHSADAIKDRDSQQSSTYDNQRQYDLESLRMALLVYSNKNIAGNQEYTFPTKEKYKTALVPDYMGQIPKDPKTNAEYEYQVSATFETFTLKVMLDIPPTGTTGYICNQEECKNY